MQVEAGWGSIAGMNDPNEIVLRAVHRPVDRTVSLPGSKSLTNRALLLAALASGQSQIEGLLLADDTRLMIEGLRTLGVPVGLDESQRRATVAGCGGYWPNTDADIQCGNAGTVMRFLTAACCLGHGDYRLDGLPRMRARPLGDLINALGDLGASIVCEGEEGFCPLWVRARGLRGGVIRFDRPPSSQFVSAILMVAPRATNDVMIDVAGAMPSEPFVAMTLHLMEVFGAALVQDGLRKFIVPGSQSYVPAHYQVEPDATAASYFFAAAAITRGRITVENLGLESCQGDRRFVDVLEKMGCRVERKPRSTTVWGPSDGKLRGVDVDLNEMPDVVQTLAVVAAFAEGPTVIRNVANLRIKETDRLDALANELRHLGVETEVLADGIAIRPRTPATAGVIDTYDDHRMAMSFAVAGLRVDGLTIRDPGCVSKTFPGFFGVWTSLAG
jgi:3-phosphoshikimate 1-carboxyvinyltransferase